MGFLTKNPTQSVNPNSPQQQSLQNDFAMFLQGLMGSPNAGGGGGQRGSTGNAWADQRLGLGGAGGGAGATGGAAWANNFGKTLTSDLQHDFGGEQD